MAKSYFLEPHDPDRKEFQIDRMILFSDAVLAIAITLLIIEIKAPEFPHHLQEREIAVFLIRLIPKFIGFVISFAIVGIYWRSHHRMFGFVSRYTGKLIFLNFLFLFEIVMLPFSSAFYSENMSYHIPLYFYNTNIILIGLVNYWTMSYIYKPANEIVTHRPEESFIKQSKARALITPIVFMIGIVVASFNLIAGYMCPMLIGPANAIMSKYYRSKS